MKLLAIETSGLTGSVCLREDNQPPVVREFGAVKRHARELLPSLDTLFNKAGWSPGDDLDLIAISIGPGSYTGLRVGMACVKTLAWSTGCDVVGIPSLDVLAQNALDESAGGPFQSVAVAVDAKRGQVYCAIYELREDYYERIGDIEIIDAEKFAARLKSPCLLLGEGIKSYDDIFRKDGISMASEEMWRARAETVADMGLRAYKEGRLDNPHTLAPIYMRRPEAEEKRLKNIQTD